MRRAEGGVEHRVAAARSLSERPGVEQLGAHQHDANVRERRSHPRDPK